VHGEARIFGYVLQSSSADRAESLGLYVGAYHHRQFTVGLCVWV
jgi:hypothetical protein